MVAIKKKRKALLVVGARPNYMKMAPIWREMKSTPREFDPVIVHTGQHYDVNMSDSFFADLELPAPTFFLGVGSASHAAQTAKIMIEFEKILLSERPDLLLVAGDVNSSLACALVASKIDYGGGDMVCRRPLIGHVEAGLRSFDRTMPEEVNRIIADSLSDILFTPSPDANENLLREGNSASKIAYVGNIMIDTLEFMRPKIDKFRFGEVEDIYGDFGLVTLHRPSNVDETKALSAIVSILIDISAKVNLVFPIHPRTKKQLDAAGLYGKLCARKSLLLLEPLSYLKFMKLLFSCKFVLTDSGGIQEESTYLRKPCLTLRPNTERPITISVGTNELVNLVSLERSVEKILNGYWKEGSLPELWDGNTANRIVRKTLEFLDKNTE